MPNSSRALRSKLGSPPALVPALLLGLGLGLGLRRRKRKAQLQGKTALVTGGSRGLGLQLVRELSRRGARVIFCARHADEVTRAEKLLASEGHTDVRGMIADISSPDGPLALFARLRREGETIDILLNNAGIIQVMPLAI